MQDFILKFGYIKVIHYFCNRKKHRYERTSLHSYSVTHKWQCNLHTGLQVTRQRPERSKGFQSKGICNIYRHNDTQRLTGYLILHGNLNLLFN